MEICYKINPNYTPVISPTKYQDRNILVVWVPGGDNRPYDAPISLSQPSNRVEWVRKGSSTVRASKEDKRRLMELASKVPFDDRVNHSANISNLELPMIEDYLQNVQSELAEKIGEITKEEIIRKMNIAKGPTEYLKPANIGLLMFNSSPHNFFRGAEI